MTTASAIAEQPNSPRNVRIMSIASFSILHYLLLPHDDRAQTKAPPKSVFAFPVCKWSANLLKKVEKILTGQAFFLFKRNLSASLSFSIEPCAIWLNHAFRFHVNFSCQYCLAFFARWRKLIFQWKILAPIRVECGRLETRLPRVRH
jgi:hypothetical protein